jgi:pSer/pThr/pTyr-binding forkhead associated (FHA) protein
MWKLVIEDDEGKRTVVPLTRDDYSIGRKEGNTIRLTERNVSRGHAKIRKLQNGTAATDPTHYVLEDQQSYNGVYVNGIRVAMTQELGHGDLIQIGDYRIVLQDDAVVEAPPPSQPDPKTTIPNGQRASLLMERPNRLVMLAGPTPGAEFPLDRERLTVGRAEDASISINHNSVSRLHCEVHALGDGRFEIVDKGSSNGVRVNNAELRRGIIEPGDVIELGDVKFKFVGAGQIFLPGVNDGQQLAAIGERSGGRRRGTLWPYVATGAAIAVVAVGLSTFVRPKPEPVVITPVGQPTAPADPAQESLDDAKRLCDTGDCDTAHEKITNEIPQGSPLRDGDDFKSIESRWADAVLARADVEQDVVKKRALLSDVASDPTVDPVRRKRAADKLQLLDSSAPTPSQLPVATVVDAAPPLKPAHDGGTHHVTYAAVPVDPPPAPAPAPTPKPTTSGVDVHQLLLQDTPSSIATARSILEPKVFGNRATAEEIRMLKTICKSQHDELCVEKCRSLLGQ